MVVIILKFQHCPSKQWLKRKNNSMAYFRTSPFLDADRL